MNRILYLQVLDYDRFSRDDPIGEVCVPLQEVDLLKGETLWKTLQPCKGQAVGDTTVIHEFLAFWWMRVVVLKRPRKLLRF